MAARKRKTTEAAKKKRKQESNIAVIVTIIFSVLLAVLLYANSGIVGKTLNEVLGGVIGILRYVLPIGSFALAIKIACNDEENGVTRVLLEYVILLICIAIIMSVYEISKGNIEVTGDLSQNIKKAYILGSTNQGGGAIGTLAAILLCRLLGNVGAVVLCLGVSIMLFIFVCGIDISELISEKVEEHIERKEEQKIEKEERMKEREEHLKSYREEMAKNRRNSKKQDEPVNYNKGITSLQEDLIDSEQIKINLNGEEIKEEKGNKRNLKKLLKKQKNEEKESVTETADSINSENSLFVQAEEEKQDKTKQVLNLEHAMSVEDDNYVFPPIE